MLVPFADMANHDNDPTAKYTYNQSGFELIALKTLNKGSVVTYDYGISDDEVGLRDYGFFPDTKSLELSCYLDDKIRHLSDSELEEIKFKLYPVYGVNQ